MMVDATPHVILDSMITTMITRIITTTIPQAQVIVTRFAVEEYNAIIYGAAINFYQWTLILDRIIKNYCT